MKTFLKFFALFLSVVAPSAPAHASNGNLVGWDSTGNDLVSACGDTENVTRQNECFAYIHGALDGFLVGGVWQLTASGGFVQNLCVPTGVTGEQIRKVVLLYADKHPADLHMGAADTIAMAVYDSWGKSSKGHPCP